MSSVALNWIVERGVGGGCDLITPVLIENGRRGDFRRAWTSLAK
jgi:hypothetical protein